MQQTSSITRQFVRIGHRHVHYRYAGTGPVLLLLHQSPQNSRMWLSMIERFSDRYTVIAPDTPGFGYSDPLSMDSPGIEHFAQATLEFADALGIDRFALFGMHTGGLIGMHLAWMAPERLHCLIVDGYALFNDAERARYTDRYLPPFIPSWDGSHLRWLWSRMREQLYFFPWCDPSAECAIRLPPYTTAGTHDAAMDILDVGDHYRSGYGAAFRYTQRERVAELRCPTWLIYRHDDVLLTHRERLPSLPAHITSLAEPDGVEGLHRHMDAILQTHAVQQETPIRLAAQARDGWSRQMVATPVGETAIWYRPGDQGVTLHLHAPGQMPRRPEENQDAATAASAHIAIELPGHGASSEIPCSPDADTVQRAVIAVCDALAATTPITLHAHAAACGYLPALAQSLGQRLQRVVLHEPWLLTEEERQCFLQQLPNPVLHPAGGHMAEAWQWERERHLLWPWCPPSAATRRLRAAPDATDVHANVVELLRLGTQLQPLFEGAVVANLDAQLTALQVPITISAADADSDYANRAQALRQRLHQL